MIQLIIECRYCISKIFLCFLLVWGNAFAQQVMSLYPDSIPNSIGALSEAEKPTITAYLPVKDKATGTAVIIFPGGAYQFLATETEGTPIAKAFLEKGIASFVVKYRLPKDATMRDKSMGPLMDGQQAIKLIKMRSKDWRLDSNKIGVMGFSAGGHLTSTLGTHYNISYIPNSENISLRPCFMLLVYPVISMDNTLTHRGSRINLLGEYPKMDKVLFFCNEEQVTVGSPPTYVTHAADDKIVDVQNSISFCQALLKKNVPTELHIYSKGDHGFIQRLPINEWLEPMLAFLKRQGF